MFRTLIVCTVIGATTLATASVASAQFPFPQRQQQPFPFPHHKPQPFPRTLPFPQPVHRIPHRPVFLPVPHLQHYHVVYRTCVTEPWQIYGTYDCPKTAYRIAERLQCRGVLARVIPH